jgi:hypothetical protein
LAVKGALGMTGCGATCAAEGSVGSARGQVCGAEGSVGKACGWAAANWAWAWPSSAGKSIRPTIAWPSSMMTTGSL